MSDCYCSWVWDFNIRDWVIFSPCGESCPECRTRNCSCVKPTGNPGPNNPDIFRSSRCFVLDNAPPFDDSCENCVCEFIRSPTTGEWILARSCSSPDQGCVHCECSSVPDINTPGDRFVVPCTSSLNCFCTWEWIEEEIEVDVPDESETPIRCQDFKCAYIFDYNSGYYLLAASECEVDVGCYCPDPPREYIGYDLITVSCMGSIREPLPSSTTSSSSTTTTTRGPRCYDYVCAYIWDQETDKYALFENNCPQENGCWCSEPPNYYIDSLIYLMCNGVYRPSSSTTTTTVQPLGCAGAKCIYQWNGYRYALIYNYCRLHDKCVCPDPPPQYISGVNTLTQNCVAAPENIPTPCSSYKCLWRLNPDTMHYVMVENHCTESPGCWCPDLSNLDPSHGYELLVSCGGRQS